MMRSSVVFFIAFIAVANGASGFDFVRYEDEAGAFSVSLPSGYSVSERDGGRLFNWTDDYMGRAFVSVSWTDDANLATDEVKAAYENLLGVGSDLSAQKTIIPDTKLVACGADDGLRGRYDVQSDDEDMRYRVTFLSRGGRTYTFVIATPLAFEEGILELVNGIESSFLLW